MKALARFFPGRLLVIFIVAILVSSCATREPTPEERFQQYLQGIISDLKLNADQGEKLRLLAELLRDTQEQFKDKGLPLLEALLEEIQNARLGTTFLTQLKKIGEMVTSDIAPEVLNRLLEFYRSLNGEQKERLSEWVSHSTDSRR